MPRLQSPRRHEPGGGKKSPDALHRWPLDQGPGRIRKSPPGEWGRVRPARPESLSFLPSCPKVRQNRQEVFFSCFLLWANPPAGLSKKCPGHSASDRPGTERDRAELGRGPWPEGCRDRQKALGIKRPGLPGIIPLESSPEGPCASPKCWT